MATVVSLKDLIESGAHFGHQVRRWNPKMATYIYGQKDGVHIFDLTLTKTKLEEALVELKKSASEGKIILFVGTKKQAKEKVKEAADAAGVYYINERWLGGTLTNFNQIKKSLRSLNDLKTGLEKGEFAKRTKKEKLLIEREITRLERFFFGIIGMDKLPEVMVVVDVKREKTALREAKEKDVKTIAIVDTNGDPNLVDFAIPMNDDASKALEYVLGLMKDVILEGKGIKATTDKKQAEKLEKEKSAKKD